MKTSYFDNITWIYSEEMNVSIGIEDSLPNNKFADIVYAKLKAGETLPTHYHNRPDPSGYEAFFFFQGADIDILLADNKKKTICKKTPFHIAFDDQELHGIVNNAKSDLIFEVICAPSHVENEEVMK